MKVRCLNSYVHLMIIISIPLLVIAANLSAYYQPKSLKNMPVALEPPKQEGSEVSLWKVEENIYIYHFEQGAGRPVLVIHGGPGIPPEKPWAGLRALEDQYRFYYYHQRGCGKSTKPFDRFASKAFYPNIVTLEKALGIQAHIADIERIRRILNQDRLILIGHSYGAFLATLYAFEFPERVQKMVLISPAGVLVFPSVHGGMDQVKAYLSEDMKKEYDAFQARYFDYGRIFEKSEKELSSLNAEYGSFYMAALAAKGITFHAADMSIEGIGGWSVHAMYLSLGQSYDFRGYLKDIVAPALVIHGRKDIYPEEASREYAELIPNARFIVLDNASHFAFEESPEEFGKILKEFLNE